MSDIHIYVQDAFYEARHLRLQSDELAQECRRLTEAAEELANVWRGQSAQRVLEAMSKRADEAEKIANNLEVISDGLQETAEVYRAAQQPGGGSRPIGGIVRPPAPRPKGRGIKVNIRFASGPSSGSSSG